MLLAWYPHITTTTGCETLVRNYMEAAGNAKAASRNTAGASPSGNTTEKTSWSAPLGARAAPRG